MKLLIVRRAYKQTNAERPEITNTTLSEVLMHYFNDDSINNQRTLVKLENYKAS